MSLRGYVWIIVILGCAAFWTAIALAASPIDTIIARIRQASGFTGPITVEHSREANAWYRFGTVIMSDKLIATATPDEIAFLMAHEVAHGSIDNSQGRVSELAADLRAVTITRRAGYDPEAGAQFYRRTDQMGRSSITHPPAWCRSDAIRAAAISYGASQ